MVKKNKAIFWKERLSAFFAGRVYPAFVAILVAFSGIFGLELYVGAVHTALIATALFVSDSLKPTLISFFTFVMQISVKHAPFYPTYSDYLYTVSSVAVVCLMGGVLIFAFARFAVRSGMLANIDRNVRIFFFKTLPLCLALLLGGAFSVGWGSADVANGALQGALFLLPVFFALGIREDSRTLAKYIAYLSLLVSGVIISELCALFITNENAIVNGAVNKTEIALGFGIWNLVGISLAVLIPMLIYGVHVSRYPFLYLAVAVLDYAFILLTASRNSALFGGIALVGSLFASVIFSERKRIFLRTCIMLFFGIFITGVAFFDEIAVLFSDFIDRGFSDNGRFTIWKSALSGFASFPVFGNGFSGLSVDDSVLYPFGALGKMAHNTVLQLLYAAGVFGLGGYFYYRIHTLSLVLKRPNIHKSFAAASMSVLILSSLLDNFIFNVYPTFYYSAVLAVAVKSVIESSTEKSPKIKNKKSQKKT